MRRGGRGAAPMAGWSSTVAAALLLLPLLLLPAATSAPPAPAAAGQGPAEDLTLAYGNGESWSGQVVRLSWRPRAFLFKGFLSDAEANHLIRISKASLTKSTVVDPKTGKPLPSTLRTSSGTFFQRGHDDVISKIEERVAAATMVPVEHQEGLQILRYVNGEKYEAHFDYFSEAFNQDERHGGQRYATMLMYLSTPEEGGETVFPSAEKKSSGPEYTACAHKGLANKPQKGDALLFYSLTPEGKEDRASLHGSCPTLKGEKWSATKWVHIRPYMGTVEDQKARWSVAAFLGRFKRKRQACADADKQCPLWAARGECRKNPRFMDESCRLSCGKCQPGKGGQQQQ